MNRSRPRRPKTTSKPTRRRRDPEVVDANAEPAATKGRPRGEAADTAFARWLDRVTAPANPERVTIPQLAEKVGLAPNSIWSIRRGRQGVSLDAARRLIEYSGGELTIESFQAA